MEELQGEVQITVRVNSNIAYKLAECDCISVSVLEGERDEGGAIELRTNGTLTMCASKKGNVVDLQ